MKSKIVAGLLALFLGGFGVHKFYLGKTGQGFLYLVFFWTGIPFVVAFIEAILFFASSDDEFNAKYNFQQTLINATRAGQHHHHHTNVVSDATSDVAEKISKLHDLKEKGAITQEEFDTQKAKLL